MIKLDQHPEYPHPTHNVGGVKKTINEIAHRIWEFQAESKEENENLIAGLEQIIEEIKNERL